jgi:exosortase
MSAEVAPARVNLWKPLVVAAAVAFAYRAALAKLAGQWWTDENYSHGLLIPFVIGYILWTERGRFAAAPKRPRPVLGALTVSAALLALMAGTAGAELFLQRASLVLLAAGVVVYFFGVPVLRLSLVPLLLLLLAIPIPAIIFNKIAFPLQLFASRCAVWAMRLFDIPVLRQGNVIELMPLGSPTTRRLEVVEACSGIRSLMTLATLAVVFAYFSHPRDEDGAVGPPGVLARLRSYATWRSVLLVLSAVPIAIITNAARVSGTGVLSRYYGTQIADGFFHEFSGWVMYVVAFLMLFALGWVLDLFGRRGHRRARRGAKRPDADGAPAADSVAAAAADFDRFDTAADGRAGVAAVAPAPARATVADGS